MPLEFNFFYFRSQSLPRTLSIFHSGDESENFISEFVTVNCIKFYLSNSICSLFFVLILFSAEKRYENVVESFASSLNRDLFVFFVRRKKYNYLMTQFNEEFFSEGFKNFFKVFFSMSFFFVL